ncbi:MAG: hypothetical protein HRT61_15985 [Ekhidna sp.]|nr:hypothetical protein [Ekhidna sp.]
MQSFKTFILSILRKVKEHLPSFFIISLASFAFHCKENSPKPAENELSHFEGNWTLVQSSLDGVSEPWLDASFEMLSIDENTIEIDSKNVPSNRIRIWPPSSSLNLRARSGDFVFVRTDSITITLRLRDEDLQISLHPPRSWSYSDECSPPDPNAFQCSNEGQWVLLLGR